MAVGSSGRVWGSARQLHRHLIWRYVEGSLAAVGVTFFVAVLGLEFTLHQWTLIVLATPLAVALYVLPDVHLIGRHYRPIGQVLQQLDQGLTPDVRLASQALVRALNLPIYSAMRVTLLHGPVASFAAALTLLSLNVVADAGFASWQTVAFAIVVLLFASPTHSIFEFFAVSRTITPVVEELWRSGADIRDEDRGALISTNLRNKLLYLTIFVTALPLLFFSASILFKVHAPQQVGTSLFPMWVWVAGVSSVCIFGALIMSILTASEVSRNAAKLARAMRRVEEGDLSMHLRPTGTDEYAELFRGFNLMTAGLRDEVRILEVSHSLSAELHLDALLTGIMQATTELLGAERSTIFVYDQKSHELWSLVAEGMGRREIRFPADQGIAGAVFSSGEVLKIDDPHQDPRFNPEIDRETGFTTRSILCAPISNKAGQKIGVTQVLNKKGGPFTRKDEARLRAFTAQIAVSLDNARLFNEVLNVKNYNENILRSTSNGLITLDMGRKVVTANEASLRLLDVSREAVIDRAASEVFVEGAAWVLQSVDKVMSGGQSDLTMDADLPLPGGGSASVNLTVTPLMDADEEHIGSMLIFEDITNEKRVKTTMARYMSKEVVEELLASGEAALGGRDQLVTVMFSDIRNFTPLAESLGARETVTLLNEYFEEMVEIISRHGGIVDKYFGDAIMCVFGVPFGGSDDADHAVMVANEMMLALRGFNERRAALGKGPVEIGVGVSTGQVVVGNIGSQSRMEYTVIGDSVNLASRLEGANKFYGTRILVSEHTVGYLKAQTALRPVDVMRVKGKHRSVTVYEALAYHDEQSFPHRLQVLEAYNQGIAHYRARQWRRARTCFESALKLRPHDTPSKIHLERCRHFLAVPPRDDWDGVWDLAEK